MMTAAARRRPRVGDVVEIVTPKGLAYAHFTHKHPMYGALLRVFAALHPQRPSSFGTVVAQRPQFITFFPLSAACNRAIVHIVANEPLTVEAKKFPVFRGGVANAEGKVETWWLWDGTHERRIGALAKGMERYPIRGIINDTLLVHRIVEGWRHEDVT